jgi:pimeloyl-ACP methyl ester carboxylesterase
MADHSISTIAIRDCRIRLMRGGAGAPLLFLHGGGGVGIWLPCMARLAKKFDVIAPEHPGFGASDTPPWLDTVGDLANFYLDFLDQLDLSGVHLIGSSLGGWIAAEAAVRNATRLASLTLVGAAGIHLNDVAQVDTFLSNEEQRIRDLFHDQLLAEAVIVGSQRPELEVPTLLIWGDHDRVFPKDYAFAFQGLIPGAKVVVMADCGHLPHVEKGDAFAAELEAFIGAMRIAA